MARYTAIVPSAAVMTIAPLQYARLAEEHKTYEADGEHFVVLTYAEYEREHEEARAYWHEQHHENYPQLACNYDSCERSTSNDND